MKSKNLKKIASMKKGHGWFSIIVYLIFFAFAGAMLTYILAILGYYVIQAKLGAEYESIAYMSRIYEKSLENDPEDPAWTLLDESEKEYIVRVRSRISDGDLYRMEKGMFLKELNQTTKPCTIERLGDRTFRIILTQGLNRQIRRMCSAVGHEVRTLKRIRVVNIELGALRPGQQRKIEGEELEALYRAVIPLKRSAVSTQKSTGKRKNG